MMVAIGATAPLRQHGRANAMEPSQENAVPPEWLPDWMMGAWTLLANFPWVLALVVFAIGLVLAGVARSFILFWGSKVTARTRTNLDEKLVRLGAGVAALIIAYMSLIVAVQTLPLGDTATLYTTRTLASLLVLQLMRVALSSATIGLEFVSQFRERFPLVEERTIPLFDLVITVLTVAVAAYVLLQVWSIDATAWLASAGVVGIAVGFAAKDTLANLFGGFFIIADSPYQVGDYVVLDNGARGEITKVGVRSTRMVTRDDVEIIIPNSEMANTKVINESGGRWTKYRIRIKVGVAYGSDVDQVVELLVGVARSVPSVCQDPEPRVRMRGFGDSSLDFELMCWIDHPSQRGLVSHELYMQIYKALGREGIEIPFPQRDVWVRQVPEAAVDAKAVNGASAKTKDAAAAAEA